MKKQTLAAPLALKLPEILQEFPFYVRNYFVVKHVDMYFFNFHVINDILLISE